MKDIEDSFYEYDLKIYEAIKEVCPTLALMYFDINTQWEMSVKNDDPITVIALSNELYELSNKLIKEYYKLKEEY